MTKKRKVRLNPLPVVTFRVVSVDFEERTISFADGDTVKVTGQGIDFPILSGDAIFLPRGGWERVR